MRRDDTVLLTHMLEAARDVLKFAAGRSRADLGNDQMLFFALQHALQIVGEAASQVSAERRAAIPAIPWRIIVGMRHRLVHAYTDINPDTIWQTVRDDIPPLIAILERELATTDVTSAPERNQE
jgi:uncharacterized protein with HEPN domain